MTSPDLNVPHDKAVLKSISQESDRRNRKGTGEKCLILVYADV